MNKNAYPRVRIYTHIENQKNNPRDPNTAVTGTGKLLLSRATIDVKYVSEAS